MLFLRVYHQHSANCKDGFNFVCLYLIGLHTASVCVGTVLTLKAFGTNPNGLSLPLHENVILVLYYYVCARVCHVFDNMI